MCMVWAWKLPNSFLVRVELRRALRLLYMCFGKGLVAIGTNKIFLFFIICISRTLELVFG